MRAEAAIVLAARRRLLAGPTIHGRAAAIVEQAALGSGALAGNRLAGGQGAAVVMAADQRLFAIAAIDGRSAAVVMEATGFELPGGWQGDH